MMVNVAAADVPPPGAGVVTVTSAAPTVAISAAVMAAVSRYGPTYVVARAAPFHSTVELAWKPVPYTVSVNAALPFVALAGLSAVMVGAGLSMVNCNWLEGPPPGAGLDTLTVAAPPAAMSPARMLAVSCVALTKVVARLAPFHKTAAPLMKFEPWTASENAAPPAVALAGDREPATGTGLSMLKLNTLEAPPPGPGFVTRT